MDKIIFPNLEAELSRVGLSKPALAKIISVSVTTLYSKINGSRDFNLGEMRDITETLETMSGQELTLDYLFHKNTEVLK